MLVVRLRPDTSHEETKEQMLRVKAAQLIDVERTLVVDLIDLQRKAVM